MKKDLNIMMEGINIEPAGNAVVWMDDFNPEDLEIIADFTGDCKPLGPNEGRIGYVPFRKQGEERREQVFEVFEYEGDSASISLHR